MFITKSKHSVSIHACFCKVHIVFSNLYAKIIFLHLRERLLIIIYSQRIFFLMEI